MAGRRQKHPSALTGHRPRPELVPIRADVVPNEPPKLPAGITLSVAAKERWDSIWSSPIAARWDRVGDYGAFVRYILDFDRWLTYHRSLKRKPLTRGSMGQPRISPLAAEMHALEASMASFEDRFWLTPASRLRAGIDLLRGMSEFEKLQRSLDDDDDDDDEDDLDGFEILDEASEG